MRTKFGIVVAVLLCVGLLLVGFCGCVAPAAGRSQQLGTYLSGYPFTVNALKAKVKNGDYSVAVVKELMAAENDAWDALLKMQAALLVGDTQQFDAAQKVFVLKFAVLNQALMRRKEKDDDG